MSSIRSIVFSAATFFVVASADDNSKKLVNTYRIESSTDEGKRWQHKGLLSTTTLANSGALMSVADSENDGDNNNKNAGGGSKQFKVTEVPAHWEADQIRSMKSEDVSYLIRLVDKSNEDDVLQVRLSPCSLLLAKQYSNFISYINEKYTISLNPATGKVQSLTLALPFSEVCDLQSAFGSSKLKADEIKHRLSFTLQKSLPMSATLPAPAADPASSRTADAGNAAGGGEGDDKEKKEDTRSFFEKYWMYILMFVGMQIASALTKGADQQQQGGPGGKSGAPKAKTQ